VQSFGLQVAGPSEADLTGLAEDLTPPAGWSFRARELSEDLHVTAADGVATAAQDDLKNTWRGFSGSTRKRDRPVASSGRACHNARRPRFVAALSRVHRRADVHAKNPADCTDASGQLRR
jgi:hypothetical protein